MTIPAAKTNDPLSSTAWAAFRRDLREFAGRQLPAATVPSRFIVLSELPKLPNGKVDRGKLPAAPTELGPDTTYTAPQSPQEISVAAVWADVLGVPRVGVHDDFFELGGNSLSAAQMAARVRAETGIAVNLRKLFEDPTVARLVTQLDTQPQRIDRDTDGNPRSISADDLAAEAALPEDIGPEPGAAAASSGPYRTVLLTGGTGYTGAYLMRELIDRGSAQIQIQVLVRAKDQVHAAARVKATMEQFGVWRDGDEQRFTCLVGDLARPYLGLDRVTYTRLAEQVEMIIHNGALSSYALPYRTLKPVNVFGTQEVLRLAFRRRIKPVHYVSSLAVYPGRSGASHWLEGASTDPVGVVGGYRQTKWVGDSMMAQAGRRGLPANVYRPGLITGAQETGACTTDTFINAAIKGCVQLGATFDFDAPLEATPVDFCAAAIAYIALEGRWHGTVFNMPGARTMAPKELFDYVAGHGYALRRLSYPDWYRELSAAVDRGEENELARFLPLFGPDSPADDVGYQGSRPVFDNANLLAALAGSGIVCAEPNQELFDRYLSWFTSIGYLPAAPTTAGDRR